MRPLLTFLIFIISFQAVAENRSKRHRMWQLNGVPFETRAISLSPAITEIIFAIGLEKNLVGASEFSDFPEAAKKLPSVGPYNKPDAEKIIQLQPDVVFVPAEGPEDIGQKLNLLKINHRVIKIRKLKEIGQAAEEVAQALGNKKAGSKFKKNWDDQLSRLKNSSGEKIPTALVIQTEPAMVAASGTFLDEVLTRCGGENIYKNLTGYPKISAESLIVKKPSLVFLTEPENLNLWQKKLQNLKLENVKTVTIDPDTSTRPGPRLLKGIETICQTIKNESI